MRKSAKNMCEWDYRRACKYHSTHYKENDTDLCMHCYVSCIEIATGFQGHKPCPRMKRWERIHKDD